MGISVLDVIPAMRNKFHTTDEIGPQSKAKNVTGITDVQFSFDLDSNMWHRLQSVNVIKIDLRVLTTQTEEALTVSLSEQLPRAQGCRALAATLGTDGNKVPTSKRLRRFLFIPVYRPALGWRNPLRGWLGRTSFPQGSRQSAATLGSGAQPLRG